MALMITRQGEEPMQEMIRPGRRLWINNAGDGAVDDGHPDAHILLCTDTDEIPADVAERLGVKAAPAPKEKDGGNDKARQPGKDKADGAG
jgi:hypothetical protein